MTTFVAVVSGKGGVGKTTTTINLGQALADKEKSVTIIDANLSTPNLALQLGFLNPEGTLNHFLKKEKSLKEITYQHDGGFSVIPSATSLQEFHKTDLKKINKIFHHLDKTTDFVVIDSPSGLGKDIEEIFKHTDEVVVVVKPTLSSVMEALKTIQLAKVHNNTVAGIVLNMNSWGRHKLKEAEIVEILGHQILANIKQDNKIKKAAHIGQPLSYLYPRSKSAKQFSKVAEFICSE